VSCNRYGHAAIAAFFLLLTSCTQKPQGLPPRYAVGHFENLSGDPSLDWVARAAPEYISATLAKALDGPVLNSASLNRAGPGISDDRAKARIVGVNHLISGYLERVNGKLRLYAVDEDLATGKDARQFSVEANQPVQALNDMVHAFSSSPAPYLTSNPDALKLYATALDEPIDHAATDLRAATHTDPNFGPAWVSLIEATSRRGDKEAVAKTIDEALSQKLDPLDHAQIRVEKALLDGDKSASLAALRDLSAQSPDDLALLKSLAESDTAAGNFKQAAADYKKIRDAVPNDRDAWNQLGYSLAWSGDFTGALDIMKQYGARWPDDPNPIDSLGDVNYMYGKFADAATLYLKADQKGPKLLNGGDLYKAAWAYFKAGDKSKADAAFAQFRTARTKTNAEAFTPFEADWLYRTGREKEAIALLRKEDTGWSQLVIWDLLAHDRAAAAKDAATEATKTASNVSTITRFAALPSASAAEWQARAEKMIRGNGAEPARRFALGIALLLDGKTDAARPVWEKIVEESSGTDFLSRNIATKLKGEKPKLEQTPDSLAVNPLTAIADKL